MPSPIYGISPPRAPGMTFISSPPGIDAINLDASEDTDDGENVSGPKSRTYVARYTGPENEILAQSWVNISEDAEIGNAQRLDAMWKRIADVYNKERPANCPVRRWDLLKTHFYTLQRSVSAFNGLYNQMKRDWGSGRSDVDILMHAMKEWAQTHNNSAFTHLGMWNILKESPKWINQQDRDYCGRKKTKTSAQGGYMSSSNPEDADEERVRPIGQKAAKSKGKGKMNHPSKDIMYEEMKQSIDKNMEEYKRITNEKLKEQIKYNKKWEYDVIMKDTTGMSAIIGVQQQEEKEEL
ncbi:glutathione S-transferase T3-like [Impatiens glandulifera]|uniref:glutathione S-transferase T3-like n=1 Tax=Impatiens glandulifera TaxID=253017 RepID=UPI001FB14C7B|nr:glutathione S-transferase T3-like [Impatiens glandulifera]